MAPARHKPRRSIDFRLSAGLDRRINRFEEWEALKGGNPIGSIDEDVRVRDEH